MSEMMAKRAGRIAAAMGLWAMAAAPLLAQAAAPVPSFTPEAFRAHVAFLSDDLLEGRDIGSRGHEIAARYVASRFEALGLKPAGDRAAGISGSASRRRARGETKGSLTVIRPGGLAQLGASRQCHGRPEPG
jgi:hypothetical protein